MSEQATGGVDVAGPPDAPELVFVHGVTFTRKQWVPQREALSEEFRVVMPDLPAHGDRSGERFRMEAALSAVDDAVERAGGSAHLVGLSLGGYVVTLYAGRNPERVDSLVVSGASTNPVGLLGVLTRIVSAVAHLSTRIELVDRAVRRVTRRWVRNRDLPPAVEGEILDAGFYPGPVGEAGFELAETDFRSAFADYPGPALLLNGRWDPIFRLGEDDHAAAGDARIEVLAGASHICNLERPKAYADRVRRFARGEAMPAGAERG